MFGFITVNQRELKIKDYETYRSYYCGLCHVLESRYGRIGQMLLNYDMTFLAILLSSLYELPQQEKKRRCIPHPAVPHVQVTSEAVEYAADMTVLLSYEKALDDWRDEKSHAKRALAMTLYRDYCVLRERYPRQANTLRRCVRHLSTLEMQGCADVDLVSGLTGMFLGEIFAWKDDLWKKDLRLTGFYLGKFVYLADALEDYDRDAKCGSYNILRQTAAAQGESGPDDPHFAAWTEQMMTDMMANASRAFERLPILQNAEILRNVLYSGVWVRVAAAKQRREKKAEKQSDL